MSKGDTTIINNEIADQFEEEIYKNLRRRSVSLTFILTIGLPFLLFFCNIACTLRRTAIESFRHTYDLAILDLDSLAIVLGWLLIQSILCLLIRKKSHQNSDILFSRGNRIITFVLSLSGVYILNWLNILHGRYVYDNINKILLASIVISYFISLLLFIKGSETRRSKQINPITAFFYGTDINLMIAGINLKSFLELQVGLIGWTCLNLCFFLKTMELYTYRRLPAFVLVVMQQFLQSLYLIWKNESVRCQNDTMKRETIGFLHVFGSLCWFPFLWILPSQYLTVINYPIRRLYIIASILCFIIGMFICRSTRNQEGKKKYIKSITFNDELVSLTSAYWPLCRQPYYLGNLFMLISWSLPCGIMPIPWILPAYYLLIICYKIR